eukprot:TRINITY_DN4834_c0_g1_i4.p1 TRINITY_DN4834_c0_g1~~TRINITY_DN4834_c0_g1_i4.p1  ORF type:complete len:1251 (+),score=191.21 TRINITY_DN4834_c0_g1_i4:40-3792(+)
MAVRAARLLPLVLHAAGRTVITGQSGSQGRAQDPCPSFDACVIQCHGTSTCEDSTATCPTDAPCRIECLGSEACEDLVVANCATNGHPCVFICNDMNSCEGTKSATCAPLGRTPDCGMVPPAATCYHDHPLPGTSALDGCFEQGAVGAMAAAPDPVGQCGSGWFGVDTVNGPRCFKVVLSAVTWSQAASECEALGSGAALATIDDATVNAAIRSRIASRAWTGLNDIANEAGTDKTSVNWVWRQTSPGSTYRNWRASEPNEDPVGSDCVYVPTDGLWGDMDCAMQYNYVCSKSAAAPTAAPSTAPTRSPSARPTSAPSASPSGGPTRPPSRQPSRTPSTSAPTTAPSSTPIAAPTTAPSRAPTRPPTAAPSAQPTLTPSAQPTAAPTAAPSPQPSRSPRVQPSASPTNSPSAPPTVHPSQSPTVFPSGEPSRPPSTPPTAHPSESPTVSPSTQPTLGPSGGPTAAPTGAPSAAPSHAPTQAPSAAPSGTPSNAPSNTPSVAPTLTPTATPSLPPTRTPSASPSLQPTTGGPTAAPSSPPSRLPSTTPTVQPSRAPTLSPTRPPSVAPTVSPSVPPTLTPSARPTQPPSAAPSAPPTRRPSAAPSPPTGGPTAAPGTAQPSSAPTRQPTAAPSAAPSLRPTLPPSPQSTLPPLRPTSAPTSTAVPSGLIVIHVPTLSPSTSAPATVSPTAPPTTSVRREWVSDDVKTGVEASLAILASLAHSPLGSAQGSRIRTFIEYSACPPDDLKELSFMSNPTRWGSERHNSTDGKNDERRDGIVGNVLLVVGCAGLNVLCGLLLHVYFFVTGRERVSKTWLSALAIARFPSFTVFPALTMLQHIAEPAVHLLIRDPRWQSKLTGLMGLGFALLLPGLVFFITAAKRFVAAVVPITDPTNWPRLCAFLWGTHRWGGHRNPSFERRYALFFKDFYFERRRFLLAEIGVVLWISLCSGYGATTRGECIGQIVGVVLVYVAYISACLIWRPFLAPLDLWCAVTVATLQLAAISVALAALIMHSETLFLVSNLIVLLSAVLLLLKALFDIFSFCRDRWNEVKARRRKENGTAEGERSRIQMLDLDSIAVDDPPLALPLMLSRRSSLSVASPGDSSISAPTTPDSVLLLEGTKRRRRARTRTSPVPAGRARSRASSVMSPATPPPSIDSSMRRAPLRPPHRIRRSSTALSSTPLELEDLPRLAETSTERRLRRMSVDSAAAMPSRQLSGSALGLERQPSTASHTSGRSRRVVVRKPSPCEVPG